MKAILRALCAFALLVSCSAPALPQETAKQLEENRKYGLKMLKVVKEEIRRSYYDPAFHGMDLESRFKLAEEKIGQATSGGQVLGVIAQAVLDLGDSHTMFIPPLGSTSVVYGWRMQMIGDACYVTSVMAGSDAEAKGLRAGDRVIAVGSYLPTRENLWKLQYYLYLLRPQSRIKVTVSAPEGREREVEVVTKVRKVRWIGTLGYLYNPEPTRPDVDDGTEDEPLFHEFGEDLIICKLPDFELTEQDVDKMMKRIVGHKTLVLDLRRNPGGYSETLDRFLGYFFDREIKVGYLKRRKGTKEMRIKPRKGRVFQGKLVVLVDSDSSSAAEVFARVVQLEKRGVVMGDHTSGQVMESVGFDYQIGEDKPILYGLSVTDADVIMADGKSLEGVGVTPDEILLPTADDLRNRRDPLLARAARFAGVEIAPDKAGDLFLIRNVLTNR